MYNKHQYTYIYVCVVSHLFYIHFIFNLKADKQYIAMNQYRSLIISK